MSLIHASMAATALAACSGSGLYAIELSIIGVRMDLREVSLGDSKELAGVKNKEKRT